MKHAQIVKQSALSQNRFNELLGNPKQAGAQEIEQLLKSYPYSHALWFLEAKRHVGTSNNRDQEEKILNSASLYASSPEQLYSFLYADPINDFTIDNQEAVAKLDSLLHQDLTESHDEVITDIVTAEDEPTILNESVIAETTITIEEEKESPSLIELSPSQEQTREDVTKYDDELMPYTFVWWLHKTRLNYADTYQPYAPKTKPNLKRLHHNISDVVLDQQIRENIFHLQSPEEKLSIKENNKTVTFNVSQKADEIIERFIKEEPQIKPPQANKITLENKAKQSAEDQSIFVSETLAQIYIEQGLYHKAIDAYMKLSLKYPEKSAYFADRIKDLENKIN